MERTGWGVRAYHSTLCEAQKLRRDPLRTAGLLPPALILLIRAHRLVPASYHQTHTRRPTPHPAIFIFRFPDSRIFRPPLKSPSPQPEDTVPGNVAGTPTPGKQTSRQRDAMPRTGEQARGPGSSNMASNITGTKAQILAWVESHAATWGAIADPSSIGLTAEQVAEITTYAATARAALTAAEDVRIESKAATAAWNDDFSAMRAAASALVTLIKGYAKSTGDASVYEIAEVSASAPPSKRPAPPQPTDLTLEVQNDGSVRARWKNKNAESASYVLYRRLNNTGAFTIVGTAGSEKEYTDGSVPVGATVATYFVVARRGELFSTPGAQVNVTFGVASSETGLQAESA